MKKVVFFAVLVVLIAGIFHYFKGEPVYSTQSEKAIEYYEQGVEEFVRFYTMEGQTLMEKSLKEDPNFPLPKIFLLKNLGYYKHDKDAVKRAEEMKESLIKGNPNWTTFENKFIEIVVNQDMNPDEAVQKIEFIFEHYPNRGDAFHILLGYYQAYIRDNNKLVKRYEQLHHLYPNNVQVINMLGYLYSRTDNLEKAKYTFEKYIFLKPNEPNPYDSYAEFYFTHGDLVNAEKYYREALNKGPDFTHAKLQLAQVLIFMGKTDEAISEVKDMEYNEVYYINYLANSFTNNLPAIDKMIEQQEDDRLMSSTKNAVLFSYYLRKGDIEKADSILGEVNLEIKGKKTDSYRLRKALVLMYQGQNEKSIELLEGICPESKKESPMLRYHCDSQLLNNYIALKQYNKAESLLKQQWYYEPLYWEMKIAASKDKKDQARKFATEILTAYNGANPDFFILREARKYAE